MPGGREDRHAGADLADQVLGILHAEAGNLVELGDLALVRPAHPAAPRPAKPETRTSPPQPSHAAPARRRPARSIPGLSRRHGVRKAPETNGRAAPGGRGGADRAAAAGVRRHRGPRRPLDALVVQLGSSRNAIYKTMFDARRKLRAALAAEGYLAGSAHETGRRPGGEAIMTGWASWTGSCRPTCATSVRPGATHPARLHGTRPRRRIRHRGGQSLSRCRRAPAQLRPVRRGLPRTAPGRSGDPGVIGHLQARR